MQDVNSYCQPYANQGTCTVKNIYGGINLIPATDSKCQWQMMCYRLFPLPNAFGSYGDISLFRTQSPELRPQVEVLLDDLGPLPRVLSCLSPKGQCL